MLLNSFFLKYLFRFIATFSILYYGTIAMIGITVPGGYYWPFAAKYLDYISLLRWMLLQSSKILLQLSGYPAYIKGLFTIRLQNGAGVHVGYDCIGYGVLIFWFAFVVSNKGTVFKKIQWTVLGLLLIWIVNVCRIALMVIATNEKWKPVLSLDNHTWFNIAAYTVIFTMIFFFDRADKRNRIQMEDTASTE